MKQTEYQIHELAEKAGVSVRTIRFYIDEGVLPAPPVRGRYTAYSPEYLDRLALIRVLKDAYLPLREIRQQLNSLDWEGVKAALSEVRTAAQPGKRRAHEEPAGAGSAAGSSAASYIARLMDQQGLSSAQRPAPQQPVPGKAPQPSPETWERIVLSPGVELHVRQPSASQERRKIQQLIDLAKKLFQ